MPTRRRRRAGEKSNTFGATLYPSADVEIDGMVNNLDWLLTATNPGNAALTETFTCSTTGNLLTGTRLTGAFTYPAVTGVRPHAPLTLGSMAVRSMGDDKPWTVKTAIAHSPGMMRLEE
jgi:hypothetical protein